MTLRENKPQDTPVAEQKEPAKEPQNEKSKTKAKGLQVGKYEISDGNLRFFVAKGFSKKKWVLVREIPVNEIEHVESEGNQLGLTVKGTAEWFYAKENAESFTTVAEQINAQIVEQSTPQENPQSVEEAAKHQQETTQPQVETQEPQQDLQQPQKAFLPQQKPQPQQEPTQQEPKQVPPEPQHHTEETQPQSELQQPQPVQAQQIPKPERTQEVHEVGKYEISEDKIRFSVTEGFFNKRWVVMREIPILEVEKIESEGNKLTVTWKGTTEMFCMKEKTGSFKVLVDQVNGALQEHKIEEQKATEAKEKNNTRRAELLAVINRAVGIVDLSFDVLIGLQDKRINWQHIESSASRFGESLNFTGQTLPPLTLEYSKIAAAINAQVPMDTSKEAFDILKVVYGYFDALKPEEDIKENLPNFYTAKTLVSAYFMLNDLLLGRFVGDKNNSREISELEAALQRLAKVNFRLDIEALKSDIGMEGEKQAVIDGSREIFKDQLKYLPDLAYEMSENSVPSSEDLQPPVS
jgi:hypothetical protein